MQRYLVIEGLIGVGKTTLARVLQEERGAELVLEPHENNPFLEPFYRDPQRYALPVQMYFLLTRWRQIDRIRQVSLFEPWVVSDYTFEKDRLFAEKTLSPEELALYDRFAQSLGERVPTPDLVVVLHAPIPVLLDRIRQRGVAGEDRINRAYLEDLHERYERQWARWDRCPLLYVDNVSLDYGRDPVARAEILRRIDEAIASGRKGRVDEAAQPSLFG
ncbi:MAG TPA: deoxynucleoside kinase [Myxococcota bacterium]|nr:deoxynucleoside kinase [Myxococcota bacterium]